MIILQVLKRSLLTYWIGDKMKELVIKEDDLPIVIKYYKKEYILKTTPKGIVLIKKEY